MSIFSNSMNNTIHCSKFTHVLIISVTICITYSVCYTYFNCFVTISCIRLNLFHPVQRNMSTFHNLSFFAVYTVFLFHKNCFVAMISTEIFILTVVDICFLSFRCFFRLELQKITFESCILE